MSEYQGYYDKLLCVSRTNLLRKFGRMCGKEKTGNSLHNLNQGNVFVTYIIWKESIRATRIIDENPTWENIGNTPAYARWGKKTFTKPFMHAAQPTPFFWFPFFQYISAMPFQGMFDYRPKSEKNNNNNSTSGNN